MPEQVRLWQIRERDSLTPVLAGALDLENRLEEWITRDPTILSPDLLIVGRQVETDYGGVIDLLCLDRDANVVLVELKRNQTPREVTAQALDYASWVRDLSSEALAEIADPYLGADGPLNEAFSRKFGTDLPEAVNQDHSILVVASAIDDSTERIIKYLSDQYGVNINAATFHYFKSDDGNEFLARLYLVEPERIESQARIKSTSKRRPNLTYEQLAEIALLNGVEELYTQIVAGLSPHLSRHTTISSIAFTGDFEGSRRTAMGLYPIKSTAELGLYFQVYAQRVTILLGITEEELRAALPADISPWKYYPGADADHSGYDGHFRSAEEVDRFLQTVTSHLHA